MRKILMLSILIFVALVSSAKDRTGAIKTGSTTLDVPMAFTATDTIKTSETVNIVITSPQLYPSKQDMYLTLGSATGSPSIAIKLYGKCFSGDTYVQIGSTQTWTSAGNNPVKIAATAPNQYRYFKCELVASGAAQTAKITAFDLKLWLTGGLATSGTVTDGTGSMNAGALSGITTIAASGRFTGTGGATITGAATNINASSNFATNIGTGSTNAAVTIGGNSNTVEVNSSSWDVSTAGAVTGVTTVTSSGIIRGNGGIIAPTYNFASAAAVTGTGDAIVIDFTPDLPTYAVGLAITFIAEAANTTAVTVNVDGQGTKAIGEYGGAYSALEANDIRSGQIVTIVYDGTQFVMMAPGGN